MYEPGDVSPSAESSRPLLIFAGLAAASMLALFGLYQGFSLTWRDYPPIQGLPSSNTGLPLTPVSTPAVVNEEAEAPAPRSARAAPVADPLDAAAPMQVADAAPMAPTAAAAGGADSVALTPAALTYPTQPVMDQPIAQGSPATSSPDNDATEPPRAPQ